MKIIVRKYGGTSVGSVERIQRIAKENVALSRSSGTPIVIVVSAMGHTTDELVSLARSISDTPDPREYDALISTGENISAALLSMAIHALGHDAVSLTGAQAGVKTERAYSKAKILHVDTARIRDELKKGKIVVVTGFQGFNDNQDVTTIGRGGSDTSAVVLAAYLNQKECEIFTDVDGIYTADPRVVPKAKKLKDISYDEMLELAALGAKVLHPRAVECAKEQGIALHVRSSMDPVEGTWVKEAQAMEINREVTGITANEDEAKISIIGVPDQPGVAGKVFGPLAAANINVDMIIQSTEEDRANTITFTVPKDDLQEATEVTQKVAKELRAESVKTDESIGKISIVGVGMMSKPGVAAKMFKTLGDNGINIDLITTSEIKISCVIGEKEIQRALQLLHTAFALDRA